MKKTFVTHNDDEKILEDQNGTHLQGDIIAEYDKLVDLFGEPTRDTDGYKVDVEWIIKSGDTVVTIYNWKNGPNYTGRGDVTKITNWHIGGHDANSIVLMNELLPKDIPIRALNANDPILEKIKWKSIKRGFRMGVAVGMILIAAFMFVRSYMSSAEAATIEQFNSE